MAVAVHNPSGLEMKEVRIAVPNYNYVVFAMDETQQFNEVPSTISCHADYSLEGNYIDSCFLTVEHSIKPRDIGTLVGRVAVKEPKARALQISQGALI